MRLKGSLKWVIAKLDTFDAVKKSVSCRLLLLLSMNVHVHLQYSTIRFGSDFTLLIENKKS